MFSNEILVPVSRTESPFKLYKQDFRTFRFGDYGILLNEATGKKRILEFGPGCSTWALIESGCPEIVTCEYDPRFLESAKEKFKDYPQVKVIPFLDTAPEAQADLQGEFDLAFVDSPKGYRNIPGKTPPGGRIRHKGQEDCSRLNTCLLALKHSPIVLLHDAYRPCERATLGRLSALGHEITFYPNAWYSIQVRIMAGGFARIERCPKHRTN